MAPYTGLGVRLRSVGPEVTLATHERFEQAVTAHGLGFRALPVDLRQELASQVGQGLARAVSPPVAMARVTRMARSFMPRLTRGVADAVRQGADVVPSSTVTDPVLTGGRSFGSHGNRLAAYALWAGTDHTFAPAVGALRRELGLPRRRFGGMPGLPRGRSVLHGFSPRIVPRPTDWPQGHEVCGYWWPQPPPGWEPDQRLLDFLDAGPPPVFAGFGSFVTADVERLSTLLADAMRRARVRGIIQAGWSGLHADPVPVQLDQHFWAPGHRRRPRPRRRHTPSPHGHRAARPFRQQHPLTTVSATPQIPGAIGPPTIAVRPYRNGLRRMSNLDVTPVVCAFRSFGGDQFRTCGRESARTDGTESTEQKWGIREC
ncbi:hypothetical protein OG453_43375 [Streptomyces sp. NBC_01381]|uniref:hypothetical protein n=1 Tax=Streptomyces sp. NBC_01381 TaxID=2903845 RepID=UPI00225BEF5C|nr:hypothetical protein [Streptomyces sp. NBC_01381]MCX4673405.1 hypothetical protein [Streptomyces sp. NBC_01381]